MSIRFCDPNIKTEYYRWLTTSHIQEVLKCEGFISAELMLEQGGSEGFVVRYFLASTAVFNAYNSSETADRLRKEAIDRFGDKFVATRRVLTAGDVFFR